MKKKRTRKGIYPVDDGSHYGEILYGYTDLEEAKRDYEEETGEELDVENCQFVDVEAFDDRGHLYFSWKGEKGRPSIVNIY